MTRLLLLAQILFQLLICVKITLPSPIQAVLGTEKSFNVTVKFDDLKTTKYPTTTVDYHHLDFSGFTIIDPVKTAQEGLISLRDIDCATSYPNALWGSRERSRALWPRITLNSTTARNAGVSPLFNLRGVTFKLLGNTTALSSIFMRCYGVVDGEIRHSHSMGITFSRGGYHEPFHIEPGEVFRGWGKKVNLMEIYGETARGDDWEFCIDDFEVEFVDGGDGTTRDAETRHHGKHAGDHTQSAIMVL